MDMIRHDHSFVHLEGVVPLWDLADGLQHDAAARGQPFFPRAANGRPYIIPKEIFPLSGTDGDKIGPGAL